jgi:predicted transcriptional regulator
MFLTQEMHTYEVRPCEDHRGVNLISDMLPFGRLLYLEIREAVDYAKFYSRSHDAVIRVYDDAGNVMETHDHAGEFTEP